MFMIDRVELIFIDQSLKMRELKRDDALGRKEFGHSGGEVVEIGNLGENIVADDEIGPAPLGDETSSQIEAEECDERRNILGTRRLGDIGGGLDAGNRNAEGQKVLKQVSIIAGDLKDLAIGPKAEPLLNYVAVLARMLYPGGRV